MPAVSSGDVPGTQVVQAFELNQLPRVKEILETNSDGKRLGMTRPSVERFAESVREIYSSNRMVVFLCGPSLKDAEIKPAAMLRKRLLEELETNGFEVVLGEDDGLEDVRISFTGGYAHDNELAFIRRECAAIVLVADSVGSFCELGLFIHWLAHEADRRCDLVLIANEVFKNDKSYFNEGPARAAEDFGRTMYVNFETADLEPIVRRLKGRRSTHFLDERGRPSKAKQP